jgi:hypothetical protein
MSPRSSVTAGAVEKPQARDAGLVQTSASTKADSWFPLPGA